MSNGRLRRFPGRAIFAMILLSACARGERGASGAIAVPAGGPDAILVRLPRAGGTARAYRWGAESVLWSSTASVPRVDRVLAFDEDQGAVAYVDHRGVPGRLDLRLGNATAAGTAALASMVSTDGWSIFGLTAKREVSRVTPSGTWTFRPARVPDALLPVADGSVVLLSDDGQRMQLRRVHPPEPMVTDSASLPHATLVVRTDLGDRIYFVGDSGLTGVRVRDLARVATVSLAGPAADAVSTPSGDRIFVALRGRKSIAVVNRFSGRVERSIALGAEATALRMDPDGRYALAREADGDSVAIVAVGTSRVVGTVRSAWRSDLPLVGPDGRIALAQDNDVVLVDAETRVEQARFLAGASDLWALIRWNGFRPRGAGLDQPVRFAADTFSTPAGELRDSALAARASSLPPASAATLMHPPSTTTPPADARVSSSVSKRAFTLSFAALLSEERAKVMAASIAVDGRPVRVVPSVRDGTPVYRIVYGPFDSREDAERAGRRSGLPFWVYEGAP